MDISALTEARNSSDIERDGAAEGGPQEKAVLNSATSNSIARGLENENKFQSAISAWRNIDLTKLVPELDGTASDIVNHQREALVSRKDLAQSTKDFRKLDDAAKLAEFKGLLKAYQTFIDLLTNHGKTTSSAFLQLYSSLSEAPDPYPLLEASVDALLLSEDTLPKVTLENEHLQKNVANLTDQLEAAEKKLAEERVARKELEDSRDAKLKEIETSWKAVIDEKRDNWEAKERSLEEKVENQNRLLNELKASFEVAQRLDHAENSDESRQNSASVAELEMVSSDLDRTSQRLAEVEGRNEQLRVELAEALSSSQRTHATEEDPFVTRLTSENSALLRKLDSARLDKSSEMRRLDGRIRTLEKDIRMLDSDRESLRERLHSWRDYSDIKRELEIFKSIEFASIDDEESSLPVNVSHDQEHSPGQSNGVVGPKTNETLEKLLLARNKKMSNEMAVLRVSQQDLQQHIESLQETIARVNVELEQSQQLNATLEADLTKVQQEASNAFPSSAMSTAGTYTSRYPASTFNANSLGGRRGKTSPTSSIISGFDPQSHSRSTLDAIRAGEPVGGGSGILPMIQAQRDRFKQKNSQLEEELSKQYATVSSLRQEVASLQKDNLNLYEKSRYVSTFNRGHQSSSASKYAPNPAPTAIQVSSSTPSGLSLDRYRHSTYEANISPIAGFRGRDATRALKRLSAPERMVFSISRMVLVNRTSRNLFAGYCFALHLLVFFMLYWMQSVDMGKHASNLGEVVGAATAAAAGGASSSMTGKGGTEGQHGDWQPEGFLHTDST